MLANPPFVPTPEGIEGTITSNGGPDGNRFVEILLKRLEEFLKPDGRALICVFQIVRRQQPLLVDLISRYVEHREVELTPSQTRPVSFEVYCRAYSDLFPEARDDIDRWKSELFEKHGDGLTLCHYIADVGPQADCTRSWVIRDNFNEKFGESLLVPSDDEKELSFARILENVVTSSGRG